VLGAADQSGNFSFDLPKPTMRSAKLTGNAKRKTTFSIKKTLGKKSIVGKTKDLGK
jgi:hypothetical protein